ncbi:hypothetical protein DsansV1_C09g0094281 [Dioscorea sansibarensis]
MESIRCFYECRRCLENLSMRNNLPQRQMIARYRKAYLELLQLCKQFEGACSRTYQVSSRLLLQELEHSSQQMNQCKLLSDFLQEKKKE